MVVEEGYFGIGIYQPKTSDNIGTLWRTAQIFGASFIFIIGARYKKQSSDTTKAFLNIPLFQYENIEEFFNSKPYSCPLVAIELDDKAVSIKEFKHPNRAVYLLGAEDHGLPQSVLEKCHHIIQLPGKTCLNVSVAGSIVIFDRIQKSE